MKNISLASILVALDEAIRLRFGKYRLTTKKLTRFLISIFSLRVLGLAGMLLLLYFVGVTWYVIIIGLIWFVSELILVTMDIWIWTIEPLLLDEETAELVVNISILVTVLICGLLMLPLLPTPK